MLDIDSDESLEWAVAVKDLKTDITKYYDAEHGLLVLEVGVCSSYKRLKLMKRKVMADSVLNSEKNEKLLKAMVPSWNTEVNKENFMINLKKSKEALQF